MLTIKVDTEQTEKHYGSLSEKDGTFTLIREADGETRTDEWNDISREQILVFLRSVGWVINKKREEQVSFPYKLKLYLFSRIS